MPMNYNKLIILLLIVVSTIVLVQVTDITSLITLQEVKTKSVELKQLIHEHYAASAAAYVALVTAVAAASLPLIIILVLAGGFLFGTILGALYATIGATLGGVISFIIFRYLLRSFVHEHYGATLARLNAQIETYGYSYLLILHYITVVPLFVITMVAALTPISLRSFVGLTMLGSAPLYLVYAFAGRELASVRCVQDIFSAPIIIACVLLVCVALIPMLIKRYQGNR